MEIRIDKTAEIPVRRQLAEQIVFGIATGELRPGEALPSVRQLARRLRIHHNTVSQAYQDLVRRTWLVGRRGRRVVVREVGELVEPANPRDLDDLINTSIRVARRRGYTLQALRDRVRERLLAEPPDHVLVVEEEPGLRRLLQEEIHAALGRPTDGCTLADLAARPGIAIGALTVAAQYAIEDVDPLVPKNRPAIPLVFSTAEEHLSLLRKLARPSVVAVVSVSPSFLNTARCLLAPALAPRHVLQELCFPLDDPKAVRSADLVFVDSIAKSYVKHSKLVHYQLISPSSLGYLVSAMKTYEEGDQKAI